MREMLLHDDDFTLHEYLLVTLTCGDLTESGGLQRAQVPLEVLSFSTEVLVLTDVDTPSV